MTEPESIRLTDELSQLADQLGREFLVKFLEVETSRHPDNVEALAELGHVYTREGRHEDGLKVDRMLVRLLPADPTVHYNLACSLALSGRPDDALDALERSVQLGYSDPDFMLGDDDLASLHGEVRFTAIVDALVQQA